LKKIAEAKAELEREAREKAEREPKPKPSRPSGGRKKSARAAGISEASVRRIWCAHGLKPHRVRTFKLSNDPEFVEKPEDIVGLYLNPPEHAIVLCADEKSQIQALDRTQPHRGRRTACRCVCSRGSWWRIILGL
jgi:hypothetical protein